MQMVKVTTQNMDSITSEGKTFLYFTAGFSPYALAMEPVYEDFLKEAEKYDVKVCRIDIGDEISLGQRFELKEMPTMLLFRDGIRVDACGGIVPLERYTNLLQFF